MRKKTGAALLSAIIPGLGQFYNRQWLKGLVFLLVGSAGIFYIAHDLMGHLHGLITLGEFPSRMVKVGKLTRMVEGDHSIFMMINGLMALLALLFYTAFHLLNIRDAFLVGAARDRKEPIHSFAESLRAMGRRNFAYLVLAIPFVAVVFLTILPLVFSVLLAFTNYADPILPPAHLVDWVGFGNFNKMLSLDVWSSTFGGVLTWTLIWAVIATATTYIGGVLIAVLIHQPRVRCKKLWRTLLIVPFAIPNMISLLVMRNMFNNQFGPINSYLRALGLEGVAWLTNPFWAKVTVILANMWIGIPVTMILAFGVLTTIPKDMYEAAEVDGAGSFYKFRMITLPMVLFATAPILIMQFAGNINSFNVIYLMTNGEPVNPNYQYAGHTDLLVTWLYKLALNQSQYSFASVIGIVIFLMVATFSIWSYRRTRSFKEEDMIA
ncbi:MULTISPECIES: sugar ABC transporter permease [Paenibacillus]|uniref:sugar ABC transporter permease n=1 Tax=Paenibacillus TaxID=44249 RepID=UPI00096FD246|nr:sugar ABC transporter permease [Paenibacillus odorifer]OMD02135.1 sugar ABC transporter permease [Paenibacillus odorifer]OMD11885.1 sugar ABC transporter permease [Paenibacillus odorifer]